MNLNNLLVTILVFAMISCKGQPKKNIQTIDAVAFSKAIQATPNAQIVDVRTAEEFATNHIQNAKNINWLSADFISNTSILDKTKPIYVYCKIGGRSQQAAEKLAELGFSQIIQLEGGYLKWEAAGLSKPTAERVGITQKEFNDLLKSDKQVLIDFYAEWCAPCKKMTPYLLKMEKEMKDQLVVVRLDADKNKSLLLEMKISELPTLLLYENRQIKWKHSGYISEADLKKQL
jgi:thioredoxin